MVELAALAVLTSEFARAPERRSAIVLAILAVTFVTGVEVATGLALFYAGVDTSLLHYGYAGANSDVYATHLGGLLQRPTAGELLHLRLGPARARRRRHSDVVAARSDRSYWPS